MPRRASTFAFAIVLATSAATGFGCSSSPSKSAGPPDQAPRDAGSGFDLGTAVTTKLTESQARELADLTAQLDAVKGLDAAGFAARYALPFASGVGYDPMTAKGLDRIQASKLALNDPERAKLGANGFVTSDRQKWPSYALGYEAIYTNDLPLFVSADSILFAIHHSFDAILRRVETSALVPALLHMLGSMRNGLGAGKASLMPVAAQRDVDFYLSVAYSLLSGRFFAPVFPESDAPRAQEFFTKAMAASGAANVTLFGVPRDVDFSQFKPRGHYAESPTLEQYFRATMWLGRIDLRLLETQPDHTQVFRRRQLEAAYAMRLTMDDAALADFTLIDNTIGAFVGEHDNMVVSQLDPLLKDLGLSTPADLSTKDDATIAQAIVNGGYGTQRISSHIMVNGLIHGTMPLSSTFLLLGQRYVIDSHVFSNLVYDRVNKGEPLRRMPNPLDVAFAVVKNDQGGLLLGSELTQYRYAPELASMRILADAHPSTYWEANLYNQWLGMLRSISPSKETVSNPSAVGLPRITSTEPWGRRILSTQLASWAELRHDTILYAKQSYTGDPSCEYPDAYVEPYPELYSRLIAFSTRAIELLGEFAVTNTRGTALVTYFEKVRAVASTLEAMAKNQRAGTPHTTEQMAFINHLVFEKGCGGPSSFTGWYSDLFFDPQGALKDNPIVADVHTSPELQQVLHVGTGWPRLLTMTIDTCAGTQAYVGVVSSYHEKITEGFERLTDETWRFNVVRTAPEPPWMESVVVR